MNQDQFEDRVLLQAMSRMDPSEYPEFLDVSGVCEDKHKLVDKIEKLRLEYRPSLPNERLDWMEDFELNETELKEIAEQRFVAPGLIPEGHITAIVGRAGSGKTTVLFNLTADMVHRGYDVVYVHADTYPSEAKDLREISVLMGVRYLTPDLKVGKSIEQVLERFVSMVDAGERLDRIVIIFDTLKKLVNVIHKGRMSALMRKFRRLVGSGATVVLLGHVNKHPNSSGHQIYEGTGDLENDCDNLIYFVSSPDSGGIVVSTVCEPADGMGKLRANLIPQSWRISSDRHVSSLSNYEDTLSDEVALLHLATDEDVIAAIRDAIRSDCSLQNEILTWCKRENGISEKRVRKVLVRWAGIQWLRTKVEKNGWRHELLAAHQPNTETGKSCQTGQTGSLL